MKAQAKKKVIYLCVLFAAIFLLSVPVQAITIGFEPFTQGVTSGGTVDVEIVISGLGDEMAASLGAFDLNVEFDDSLLSLSTDDSNSDLIFDSVTLDPDNQLDLSNFGLFLDAGTTLPKPNTLNLYCVSFDFESDLNFFQEPDFTLATITFDAISAGTVELSLSNVILGDAAGDPLDFQLQGAPVPEPATILLLGIGIIGIAGFRKRKK